MTACVLPGSYGVRYELCLMLPEFKYPEYHRAILKRQGAFLHEVYLQPDWLGSFSSHF